jgi:hypothetical protein
MSGGDNTATLTYRLWLGQGSYSTNMRVEGRSSYSRPRSSIPLFENKTKQQQKYLVFAIQYSLNN